MPGGGVDDGGGFDTVETDGVLLVRAAGEADVIERAATGGLGAGSEEVELGDLAAVDGHLRHFARIDVGADGGRAGIDDGEFAAGHGDFSGHRGRLHDDVNGAFLAEGEVDFFVRGVVQAGAGGDDGVGGGAEIGDEEDAGIGRFDVALGAGFFVSNADGCAGDDGAGGIGNDAGKAALVLGERHSGQSECE